MTKPASAKAVRGRREETDYSVQLMRLPGRKNGNRRDTEEKNSWRNTRSFRSKATSPALGRGCLQARKAAG